MGLALRNPSEQLASIPTPARIIWFAGLAFIIAGALMGWGRYGERLARYSLLVLGIYYGGMWMAHQSAMRHDSMRAEGYNQIASWPTPANPMLWQSVARKEEQLYTGYINLLGSENSEWREAATLAPGLVEALRQSPEARVFMDFTRFAAASVEERADGYSVSMRDLRFDLRMRVELDRELNVLSTDVRWF
jgi:hypothetical protein